MTDLFSQKGSHTGRGIDTISHYFLSDQPPPHVCRTFHSESSGDDDVERPSVKTPPGVVILFDAAGVTSGGTSLGCMLALSLAALNVSVGFIETTVRLPHTFFLFGGYKNIDALFWEEDLGSSDFSNIFSKFKKTFDVVLLHISFSAFCNAPGLSGPSPRYLVPTTVDPEDLLSTYGMIKRISTKWSAKEIDIAVMQRTTGDNASNAMMVLEKMAKQFLPCSVRFVGIVPMTAAGHAMPRPCVSLPSISESSIVPGAVEEVARNLMIANGSIIT